MKSGIALEMCLIGALSRLESFPANVLFLAVPDEENTSAGMRGAVPWLVRLRNEWELEYTACLNSEPSVGGRGIPAGGVYVGTIGKIMPFYLCVGKEAHVGDYYEGVSASLLTSYLSLILEGSPETAESDGAFSAAGLPSLQGSGKKLFCDAPRTLRGVLQLPHRFPDARPDS